MTIHLSIVLWLPAVAGVLALAARRFAGWVTLAGSLLAFAYSVVLLIDFNASSGSLQYVTDEAWIEQLGIHYKLGVDGLNLALIVLTTFGFTACTLWAALERDVARTPQFFFWMGLAHSAVLGALFAQDLILFVLFFDLMLVPFFFLTLIWGPTPRPDRVRAILKLFIYTLVGSLLMLAGAIATGVLSLPNEATTFVLSDLERIAMDEGSQRWIFLCFAAAFLVKMPAFPVHGWMPDGYRNMPLPVLAVFSAVLSKVAAYGFLRVVMPLFPDAAAEFQMLALLIALASILYGSAMAFTTTETRLILGYSSVAQLGFITLGVFALDDAGDGAQGAILQSVNHGLVVLPAFFIVGLLAARAGSEDLRDMGGVAFRAPVLAGLFLIVALATLAMPGSANFVGEFMILFGVFDVKIVIAIVAFTGVVLASVYMLRMFIRSMHDRVGPSVDSRDIRVRDGLVLVPLVAAILFLALYPQLPLEKGEQTIPSRVQSARQVLAGEEIAVDPREAAAEAAEAEEEAERAREGEGREP
ncbi:MAG TPA: NADH-quinone oxidoreductase subunit M [Solirubrobacteraceae bacterium]|jgi:NADH-quinone oxidoreductase subunit M